MKYEITSTFIGTLDPKKFEDALNCAAKLDGLPYWWTITEKPKKDGDGDAIA